MADQGTDTYGCLICEAVAQSLRNALLHVLWMHLRRGMMIYG